ncbi:hypothetical protein J2TS4_28400 [Paenibacillus sp. J2TS4]|nr:hypothetical protein J2TS4_28400 [Paenibacillus sp. J2TS4]
MSAFQSFLTESKLPELSSIERQKIQRARDIMLERMANPPSLIELSRMIGLNDNKLKIGFKGCTSGQLGPKRQLGLFDRTC